MGVYYNQGKGIQEREELTMNENKRSKAWEMAQSRGLDNEWDETFGYGDDMYLLKDEDFALKFAEFVLDFF